MISPGAAAQHKLKLGPLPPGMMIRGIGGTVEASVAAVKAFTLAGTRVPDVEFIVGGSDVGSGAAGLLGQNVLGIGDVEYDLANGIIRLLRPHDCERAGLAFWAGDKPVAEMEIHAGEKFEAFAEGTAVVNGVKIRALFDTGASTSMLTRSGAARAGLKIDGPGVVTAGMSGGVGRKLVRTWLAPVASFELGGERVNNTRLRIGDTEFGKADMLIGADFFLSHHIYVANTQSRIYFTYNGGPVFNLSQSPESARAGTGPASPQVATDAAAEPKDADAFSRRGAASLSRRDYGRAEADFNRAVALAPEEPRYLYQRALARIGAGRAVPAMADLDAALKLKPDDVEGRIARARLRLAAHEHAGAREDLDAAARLAPKQADLRLQLASGYMRADRFEQAIGQLDLWIDAHRDDSRLASALNERCWARALPGRELAKAVADCDAALRLAPKSVLPLDSRGLVQLRLGNLDRAIADYDAALALQPKLAWSLYGRGLARLREGLKAEGEADVAAATALDANLPKRAKTFGLAP